MRQVWRHSTTKMFREVYESTRGRMPLVSREVFRAEPHVSPGPKDRGKRKRKRRRFLCHPMRKNSIMLLLPREPQGVDELS